MNPSSSSSVTGVIHKTHGFFSTLKHRLSRGRSKERVGRKSPNDFLEHESTDYAADYSSDNSSSVTPANSPRHRATTIGGSPLAREMKTKAEIINQNKSSNNLDDDINELGASVSNISSSALERLQVSIRNNFYLKIKNKIILFYFSG